LSDIVNIGFMGCGGNARSDMRALNHIDGAQIVAVCDLFEKKVKEVAELTRR